VAITSVSSSGATQNKTAGAPLGVTTTIPTPPQVVVCIVAVDNVASADGETSEIAVADPNVDLSGNIWEKLGEFCNSQGGANSGATVAIWCLKANNNTIYSAAATPDASVAAKASGSWRFNVGAGKKLALVAGSLQTLANDGADPGSMTISGLPSKEYLFVRAIAGETNSTTALTGTASYTVIPGNQTSGGGAASNMAVRGEFRILTGTGDTSNPTWVNSDAASLYLALEEVDDPAAMPHLKMAPARPTA
jgi:hypothetical protein